MENRPFRLITSSPVEGLARTVEALLVVASSPLGVSELAEAADDDEARVEARSRWSPSGSARDGAASSSSTSRAATASAPRARRRRRARGSSSGRSSGRCRRPRSRRSRWRRTSDRSPGPTWRACAASRPRPSWPGWSSGACSTEAGREPGVGGAVRYGTTELFERVFGLESLSALPRLDDLGDDAEAIRDRLEAVAAQRGA